METERKTVPQITQTRDDTLKFSYNNPAGNQIRDLRDFGTMETLDHGFLQINDGYYHIRKIFVPW